MHKLFASCFIVLLLAGSILAVQEGKIKGLVNGIQADGTKLPLAGAVVTLQGTAINTGSSSATTDEEGRFALLDLPSGDFTIKVEIPGFETYTKSYKLLPGSVADLTIDMKLSPVSTDVVEVKADT